MSNIEYIKGDLFELAPEGAYLAQAVNCQGVWGSGIAKQFRKRYPKSYIQYVDICIRYGEANLGCSDVLVDNVIVFYTSVDYGKNKDSVDKILNSTYIALEHLIENNDLVKEIHMPKINSGLFAVPWEETEKILLKFPEITFKVYEL